MASLVTLLSVCNTNIYLYYRFFFSAANKFVVDKREMYAC